MVEQADHIHKRAFAAAARAHHGDALALRYLKTDLVERYISRIAEAVQFADVFELDKRHAYPLVYAAMIWGGNRSCLLYARVFHNASLRRGELVPPASYFGINLKVLATTPA